MINQFRPGDTAIVKGFNTSSATHYLKHLLAMGLTLGARLKVIRRAPLGDPIQIEVRGTLLSLRSKEADILRLEKLD